MIEGIQIKLCQKLYPVVYRTQLPVIGLNVIIKDFVDLSIVGNKTLVPLEILPRKETFYMF